MKGYEITKQLKERKNPNHQFIKWWRKENDFLDYDLIDRYVNNFDDSEEIAGFDLIDSEQMWAELKHLCGDRIARVKKDGGEYISWRPASGRDAGKTQECQFSSQSLIAIFDRETRGNPVDS